MRAALLPRRFSSSWVPKTSPGWSSARYEKKPVFENEANPDELRIDHYATAHVLSMHRPKQLNALTEHMCSRLERVAHNMNKGAVTSFFILRGSQVDDLEERLVTTERDRYFCVGTDMLALSEAWSNGDRESVYNYYKAEAGVISTLVNVSKPWAAGLDGTVMGSGAGLAMHATFKFASGAAVWSLPETSYGAVPGYGSSYELSSLEDNLGIYLALTGRRIVGHDMLFAGLATHVIDPSLYGEVCLAVSMQNSTEMKYLLPVLSCFDQQGSIEEEPFALQNHLTEIGNCFRFDSIEQIKEALVAENTDFSRQTLRKLNEKSLASLKLTLRLLREGQKSNDVVKSLEMEHALQIRLWNDEQSDLHYGLKNVVFNNSVKSADLAWRTDVTDAYVEKMFAAPSADAEVLALPEVEPRPPTEAPQLFQYYSDIADLEGAPAPIDALQIEGRLPDAAEVAKVGAQEIGELMSRNMHKVLPRKSVWHVEKKSADDKDEFETIQKTEFGELIFGRDTRTGETVQLTENVKRKILAEHKDIKSLNIFRTQSYDVHRNFDISSPMDVALMREAIDGASYFDKEHIEPSEMPYGLGNEDRVVSSESIGEVFARPFFSADEEVEEMLKVMGHVEKKPDNTDANEVPNFHNEKHRPDKRPLTERELKL